MKSNCAESALPDRNLVMEGEILKTSSNNAADLMCAPCGSMDCLRTKSNSGHGTKPRKNSQWQRVIFCGCGKFHHQISCFFLGYVPYLELRLVINCLPLVWSKANQKAPGPPRRVLATRMLGSMCNADLLNWQGKVLVWYTWCHWGPETDTRTYRRSRTKYYWRVRIPHTQTHPLVHQGKGTTYPRSTHTWAALPGSADPYIYICLADATCQTLLTHTSLSTGYLHPLELYIIVAVTLNVAPAVSFSGFSGAVCFIIKGSFEPKTSHALHWKLPFIVAPAGRQGTLFTLLGSTYQAKSLTVSPPGVHHFAQCCPTKMGTGF